MIKFSILITTKNRLDDLQLTLQEISPLFQREDVECLVYDDASTDATVSFIKESYPNIQILTNQKNKGYIHNRNYLLNHCKGNFAISLDDDACFLSENYLEIIENYFASHTNCGVIACRIFWNKEKPSSYYTNEVAHKVKGYVGCGHIWNIKAWKAISKYPEWYEFYGEEDFASLELLKKGLEVHYVPEILVQHRVNVSARRKDSDYQLRRRRSLRAGWYNYFLFYPISIIPKKMAYTIWQQIKNHTFKGNVKATLALVQALFDVVVHIPKFIKNSNRLTIQEYKEFTNLPTTKIYWKPENE